MLSTAWLIFALPWSIGVPQFRQNFASAAFSCPQILHLVMRDTSDEMGPVASLPQHQLALFKIGMKKSREASGGFFSPFIFPSPFSIEEEKCRDEYSLIAAQNGSGKMDGVANGI